MKMSKQSVSILVIILFLFQFSVPLIQTGIGHIPPECEKLRKKWKKKSYKHSELILERENLRNSRAWKIAKEAFIGATIGTGLGTGASGVAKKVLKDTAKNILKRAGIIGFITVGGGYAIGEYRRIKKQLDKLDEKINEVGREADEAWKEYIKCLKHDHASGSLTPYMDSPTDVRYGEIHYALLQCNMPYTTVYWYVRAPDETGYGTNVSTDSGDGAKMSSTFSFTAPHTLGTYTITAYIYFNSSIVESSYDVYVLQ